LLAAFRRRSYFAATLGAVAACSAPSARLAPEGAFAPLSAEGFRAVAARTVPPVAQLLQIHWRYEDGDRAVSGRGAVRLAPPDSLRLDVAVSVLGRATLVLAGDSAWAQPEDMVSQVLPSRSIVWGMMGIVRPPGADTRIEVGQAADRRLYRLTAPDGVATTLEISGDALLGATQERGGRQIGRLVLARDAAGALVRAEATDVEHGSRFAVDVDRREASEAFPSEIWRRP
jgi:hypothetical protein